MKNDIKRIYAKERDAIRRGGGEIGKVGEIIVGCNRSEQLALMCASEEAVVNKWRVCGSWFYVFCLAPDSRGSSDERLAEALSVSLGTFSVSISCLNLPMHLDLEYSSTDLSKRCRSPRDVNDRQWKWILHFEQLGVVYMCTNCFKQILLRVLKKEIEKRGKINHWWC